MTDREALWGAVLAEPSDQAPKLVLADWYDENGDHDAAECLRWIAAKGRWPVRRRVWGNFQWWDAAGGITPLGPDDLPHCIFQRMSSDDSSTFLCEWVVDKSVEALVFLLLTAWGRLTAPERTECWAWEPRGRRR